MRADRHELNGRPGGMPPGGDCKAQRAAEALLGARLSALPSWPAPPGAWAGAQVRLAGRRAARPRLPAVLAMAASLLVIIAAALLFAGAQDGAAVSGRKLPAGAPLEGLVAENARLEATLAGLPRPSKTRLATAYTLAAIEDRLALVDDRITAATVQPSSPETAEQLWRERVTLMDSLVKVQYASLMASR